MRFNSKEILILCILALYLERELACRNLGYWINNTNNTFLENLWLFSKPYQLILLTFFLVVRKHKLSIIPIIIGIIGIISTSNRFITWEIWQYNNFDDYELFTSGDSLEIRTIFTICVKIVFYATAFCSYYKFYRSNFRTD
jgi:hypothetical protein